ncbi:MAG TPA: prolipoprotein diacylglyceryl transferase [Spirochaetota bacterium]|jgi:phosphatidylglycerol:prolipoprotein diacylglycerol transferase|nr:prolipoprotein diacylglyceryl transferase [Spirochaetota bacterium]HPV41981.1 prolipoprotein diacylglyceryl transferase [Spirochaetota bacterium]
MYPILFSYKFINIGSYGLMLGLAFYLAFLLTERELTIRGKDPELAYKLLLVIIPSAIIGAKIFHIFENMGEFLRDPKGMIFSGAGLSVYGGFILAFLLSMILIRKNKESILEIFDIVVPAMTLAYGVGRLGCHVSGDGCYGIATSTFLGTPYPNGIVPVTAAVFPTPLFESFVSFMFFILFMKLRKKELPAGIIFFLYLILNGTARFLVEFIRLNPKFALELTQGQIVGILYVITGALGIFLVRKQAQKAA